MPLPPGSGVSAPPRATRPPAGSKPVLKPKPKPKPPASGTPAAPVSPYQQQAQSEIDPIIAAITAAAQNQAQSADAAIQGLTDSYAKGISGIDYGSPYASAESQQAAVDAALQQAATGQGNDLASQLSQRLSALQGSSGADAVNQAAQALSTQGSGIGGAQVASGSAALDQLIADAAAARGYGQKMPGVIDSAGLQGIEQSQGQAQQAINSGTLQAESQLPSIEQTLKADALQAESQKQTQAYRAAEIAARNATLGLTAAKDRATIAQGNQRLALQSARDQTLAAQGAARIQLEAQRAAQTALNSNRSYSLSLSRLGIENKHLQLEALTAETKLKNGGFTAPELVKLRATASQVIASGKQNGYTRAQVINNLVANGVPVNLVGPQLAAGGYPKPPKIAAPPISVGQVMGGKANGLPFGPSGIKGASALRTPQAKTIVGLANEYLGTPYVWGGESPKGFDCSGFAQYLYGKAGIAIPRTTYTQWTAPYGRPVPKGQLSPGDLVFYKGSDSIVQNGRLLPGHVGIYIGEGKVINAYGTGYGVRVDNVNSPSLGGYMGARRFGKA